jgi:tellurite resistance protein TerC
MGLRQLYFLLGGLLKRLVYLSLGLAVILAFIGVKLVMEALHENTLPFINGGEHIEAVPAIPIWLSLSIILGVLVIATVASLIKTRGELIETDETLVEPETADSIPSRGPEALAEAEPRLGADSDEERSRR